MGGATSKHLETQDGWKTSLSRSTSTPTSSDRLQEQSSTKASWKARLLSMPQTYNRGRSIKLDRLRTMLKPVHEEEEELESENPGFEARDCEYGQDGERRIGLQGTSNSENSKLLKRSQTFNPVFGKEPQHKVDTPLRNPKVDGGGYSDLIPSNLSSRDLMDQSTGLRLLLDPPSSSSRNLLSPSRAAHPPEQTRSSMGSFNARHGNEFANRAFTRVSMDDASPLEPQWITDPDALNETDNPLFDPSILATFEKAVENMAHTTWQSEPANTVEDAGHITWQSAPAITSKSSLGSSEMRKDAAIQKPPMASGHTLARMKSLRSRSAREDNSSVNLPQLRSFSFLKRKPSFSKVFSLRNDKRTWSSETYLDKFVRMCPPDCEGKVVLYFTSLRGVRKTFEDCYTLRLILNGFRIHVDERDVWMHSKFRQELTDVMGIALSVPRLFILGRYIGGADEVELLNEEGILAKLLEGLPTECKQVCKVCADVRFIPCIACRGSRKIVTSNDATERCSKCNENGLIMCPMCK